MAGDRTSRPEPGAGGPDAKDASRRAPIRLLIAGRVQGVSYRASMRHEAQVLGVDGWVRNLADGRVEACIAGRPGATEALIDWCRRGPPGSLVTEVVVEEKGGAEQLEPGFTIRATLR